MSPAIADVLIVVAGAAAGTINGAVGSGNLVPFALLLSLGYSPLTANISTAIGLLPGSVTAAGQYRRTLAENPRQSLTLALLAGTGGAVGGVLLVLLPTSVFSFLVPVLIVLALLVVVLQPVLVHAARRRAASVAARASDPVTVVKRGSTLLVLAVPAIGVYGGYFGAGQGVVLLGVLGVGLVASYAEVNGLKNLLALAANIVAGVIFVSTAHDHLDWSVAACVALGSIGGGVLGARAAQRLPQSAYRAVILVVGVVTLVAVLLR